MTRKARTLSQAVGEWKTRRKMKSMMKMQV
jgi:hypothetical protein